jgi:hypothetical protein
MFRMCCMQLKPLSIHSTCHLNQETHFLCVIQETRLSVSVRQLDDLCIGIAASSEFITNRLGTYAVKFYDCMPKSKLSTFSVTASAKTITTSKHEKILMKAEMSMLWQLPLLSQEHDKYFDTLFTYSLSLIPWSLSTPYCRFYKTNKVQLMLNLEEITGEHHTVSSYRIKTIFTATYC